MTAVKNNVISILPDGGKVGGVSSWAFELTQALKAAQIPAQLFIHEWQGAISDSQLLRGPDVKFIPISLLDAQVAPWTLRRFFKLYRHHLPATLIPNYSYMSYAICAQLAQAYPDQIRVLGMCHTDQAYYYDLLDYYEPIIDTFVGVSAEISERLRAMFPQRYGDIQTRAYAVQESQLGRRKFHTSGPIRLLYAGRLIEFQKRISDLIELANLLVARGVDFELELLGEGKDQANFLKRLNEAPQAVRGRVRVRPPVNLEHMPQEWHAADISVLVSDFEGTSIAMLESMAQGCIPVVTQVSGTAAVIRSGQNGFSVSVGDLASMADRIQQLAQDPGLRARLSAAAQRTTQDHHSPGPYQAWLQSQLTALWSKPDRTWPSGRAVVPAKVQMSIFKPRLGLHKRWLKWRSSRMSRQL
jgi:glycosyltransferase involved in cell wall biosynthesis